MTRAYDKVMVMVRLADDLAGLSTCARSHVGAVLFSPRCDRVHAMGYSGPPVGLPNDSCRSDTDACGCAHAEVNALLRAVTAEQMIMATTTSPCSQCAAAILNSCRVAMVVYRCSYRDEAARELLQAGGVIVTHATQQCVIDDTIVRMVSWDKETRNGWTRERP